MEKSLSYMEKAFKDMESFLTDFQGGNDDQNTDENTDDQNHDDQ